MSTLMIPVSQTKTKTEKSERERRDRARKIHIITYTNIS